MLSLTFVDVLSDLYNPYIVHVTLKLQLYFKLGFSAACSCCFLTNPIALWIQLLGTVLWHALPLESNVHFGFGYSTNTNEFSD